MLRFLAPAVALGAALISSPSTVLAPTSPAASTAHAAAPVVHCQVPCGIYGDKMRIDMLMEACATIEKAMDSLIAMDAEASPSKNQMVRWVMNKESHAQSIQDTVAAYWMAQRIKAPAGDTSMEDAKAYHHKLALLHGVTVAAMKCKQGTDKGQVERLRGLASQFSQAYFSPEDMEHMKHGHGEEKGHDHDKR